MKRKLNLEIKERKYATVLEKSIHSISIGLATSDDVKEWSHGEVKKPETINYKSFKPEKSGLFDEIIFGPTTDYKCPVCGTKYKRTNHGQICEKTDECRIHQPEILPKSVKRTRMGHIKLASPVVHFWFFKINHSVIAKLLGLRVGNSSKVLSKNQIESLIYFKSHIVLEDGGLKSISKNEIIDINKAPVIYRNIFREILETLEKDSEDYKYVEDAIHELEEIAISKIGKDYGIDFYELNEIVHEFSDAKIGTGSSAIEYLLEKVDLKKQIRTIKLRITKLNKELEKSKKQSVKIQQRVKYYKRLEVLNAFIKSGQDPKNLLIRYLPVIPADLRPLVQIEGGRHSTTDINELYRRIIIRNNRLKKWIELDAPILIRQNEMRMLQEAVDALIDNERKKPSPIMSKDNRPLKSFASTLSGKKGRFRLNLLGKRVDYSGRSVIVVGPELKMYQAGIPRIMAAKLFEPWIIHELVSKEVVSTLKAAKRMVEDLDNRIWPFVEQTIKGKVVLLNRAPTLHRLSIQAFEPVLVRGQAIKLHPLVTTAFNADFDGDQMAVHVPISPEAIRESKELMMANKNILGPKDGEPIINPSQDMILGLYFLTREVAGVKGEGNYYNSYDDMIKAYEHGFLSLNARVAILARKLNKDFWIDNSNYVISSVGKFIFNNCFPSTFPFIFDDTKKTLQTDYAKFLIPAGSNIRNEISKKPIIQPFNKKIIANVIRHVFDLYDAQISKEDLSEVLVSINSKNYQDVILKFEKIKTFKNEELNSIHKRTLSKFVIEEFLKIQKKLKLENEGVVPIFEIKDRVELLEKVWFRYTNVIGNILDNIKDLGFEYSTLSGVTMSISDIIQTKNKSAKIANGENYISSLNEYFKDGLITDDERYRLVIKKWIEVKNDVQEELNKEIIKNEYNPIFFMMNSGARGNMSNYVQLAGMRGLMANNKKQNKALTQNEIEVRSTVEVPIKSSFLEGLTAYEFYSSTHGARKGLTDTALNTANSGYLTRRLIDVAQNIVVREHDCGSDYGLEVKDIIDTKTGTVIVPISERIEGRFTNKPIYDKQNNLIVDARQLITPKIAEQIINAGIKKVEIRSVLGCHTKNGVCKICYGKDLASNRIVQIGEAVGIISAQSIGEPGTQLTMRTFHTGGVAGVQDITGGFDRLKQLIDATKQLWEKPAIISKTAGKVVSIKNSKSDSNKLVITIENTIDNVQKTSENKEKSNDVQKRVDKYEYEFVSTRKSRVKVGDYVVPGQKLVDGPITLDELLDIAGPQQVQKYILKEIQRIYRMQGITISDKYIEIIIRQMVSKILIQDPGDSGLFAGSIVDINTYTNVNKKLLSKYKKPAYGTIILKGAKQIPLLSDSFLAAASYQETAKVLVHAAIEGKLDKLEGLKENIIAGHKIPAGTASNYELKGKYDIKDPRSYFENKVF